MSDLGYELSIERRIASSPSRVWQVMTEQLAEWWCPKPWRTEIRSLQWHAGGACNMTMHGPNGEASGGDGVMLEVVPEKRFVFTDALTADWQPQKAFMVGVFAIEPDGEGTLYRASARHWTAAKMEEHRKMGFEEGWGVVADQLKALAESA